MSDRELLELAAKAAGIVLASFDENDIPSEGSHARIWPRPKDGELAVVTAAPTVLFWNDSRDHPMCRRPSRPGNVEWNPLTDDGDALRLAVKLGLVIDMSTPGESEVRYWIGKSEWPLHAHAFNDYRRAIVRAAAEIGRSA